MSFCVWRQAKPSAPCARNARRASLPRALAGDFAPRAHTSLLAKDSALALAMAAQAGLRPPLGTLAAAQFQAALAAGFGGEDDARLLSLLQAQFAAASQAQARAQDGAEGGSPGAPG